MSPTLLWNLCTFATIAQRVVRRVEVPNLAALCFRSLTLVSYSGSLADRLDLSVVRVSTPMVLLAKGGVLHCSTLGCPMLPSAIRFGI